MQSNKSREVVSVEKKTKSKAASIIYVLFVILFIWGRIANIQPMLCNFFNALSGVIAFGYCFLKKRLNRINSYLILFGILFSVAMLLSILYNKNADYLDILWIWSYMGIAALIYQCNIPSKVFWVVAYTILLSIMVYMFQGNAADKLLKIGSVNNISAYIIFFVILGYLSEKNKENKTMTYIPSFFTLAISLWTGSRAGILSAVVLVGCIFINNFFIVKKKKISTLFKICLLIFVGIWAVNHFFEDYMAAFFEKMKYYGNTSVRTEIWLEYINGMFDSLGNFLFGVNMLGSNYPLLKYYSGNTHNSFLMLHAKYGVIGVLGGCLFIFKAMWRAKCNKNTLLIMMALVASTRMFFDWIAFPGLYDIIFWLLVIYAIDKRNVLMEIEEYNEAK